MNTTTTTPTPLASSSPSTPHGVRRRVAVFGASWCNPGSELYDKSIALGTLLASNSYTVVNGGYGGTMEGVSKGASLLDGSIEGVLVSSLFKIRSSTGNEFLTMRTDTPSLLERIKYIIESCDYFIVLPGTLGTLTELCAVWNIAGLAELGLYRPPKIYCYRDPWEKALFPLVQALNIPAAHFQCLQFIDTPEEVIELINADVAARENGTVTSKGSAAL